MTPARLLPAVALAAGLLVCASGAAQPIVHPVGQSVSLPVVPPSAGAFVTLKVRALATHPDLKPVLAQLAKQPDALAGVSDVIGVSPLELDRITLFWPRLGRDTPDPVLVVTTVEPFNEARVLKNLKARPVFDGAPAWSGGRHEAVPRPAVTQPIPEFKSAEPIGPGGGSFPPGAPGSGPAPKVIDPKPLTPAAAEEPREEVSFCAAHVGGEVADPLFYTLEGLPFSVLFLVDDRTLVFLPGRPGAELTALALLGASLKKGAGPLADALADAGLHTLAAGVYLPPLFRDFDRRADPALVPYAALLTARTVTLTGDLDKTAKLALTLAFEDAAAAKRAAPVLEEGLGTVGQWVEGRAGALRDSRNPFDKAAAPLLGAFAAGLKRAAVKPAGANVLATAEVDAGPATAKAVGDLLAAVQSRRQAELRTNNLKQIGLALHSYHDVNGRMPTNVCGPKGELLLSWRVLLLPYLEEEALYKQFKLDEPWDGPNNKLLVEKMPKVFQAPDREQVKGRTFYQAFVQREQVPPKGVTGRPWLKNGEKQGLPFAAFTDGLSNTLAVVEAGQGVMWSKPDDLPFGGAVPALGEKGWDRTPALRFDGSVLLFPTRMRPEEFWPHTTINGGEVTRDPTDDRAAPFGLRPGPDAPPPLVAQAKPAAKEPGPARQLLRAGSSDPNTLAILVALCREEERTAAAQVEAAARVVQRLEQLAEKGAVTAVEVVRAKGVVAAASARLDEIRRAAEQYEAALKAAGKVAPRK